MQITMKYDYFYKFLKIDLLEIIDLSLDKWRFPSLSELTPMVFNMGLTHLGSEASNLSYQTTLSGQ